MPKKSCPAAALTFVFIVFVQLFSGSHGKGGQGSHGANGAPCPGLVFYTQYNGKKGCNQNQPFKNKADEGGVAMGFIDAPGKITQ